MRNIWNIFRADWRRLTASSIRIPIRMRRRLFSCRVLTSSRRRSYNS